MPLSGPLLVTTRDWYEQGVATAQVRLFGLIPVMGRHGADLARSARGRLVVESTWLPSSFLPEFGAHWSEEGSLLQLTMSIDNEDVRVTMRVESDGLLRELSLQRWSNFTDPQEAGSMLSPSAAPFSSLSNIRRYMHAISRFLRNVLRFSYGQYALHCLARFACTCADLFSRLVS